MYFFSGLYVRGKNQYLPNSLSFASAIPVMHPVSLTAALSVPVTVTVSDAFIIPVIANAVLVCICKIYTLLACATVLKIITNPVIIGICKEFTLTSGHGLFWSTFLLFVRYCLSIRPTCHEECKKNHH
jgi:hypothetical protein